MGHERLAFLCSIQNYSKFSGSPNLARDGRTAGVNNYFYFISYATCAAQYYKIQ